MEELDQEIPLLDQLHYRDMTLLEWEQFLTVQMPAMPATAAQLSSTLADINNKYQACYNAYNEILAMNKNSEIKLKHNLSSAIEGEVTRLTKAGAKKLPGRETLESIAFKNNEELILSYHESQIYLIIAEFFENNKNKLSAVMRSTSDLLYAASQSDRMFNKVGIGGL